MGDLEENRGLVRGCVMGGGDDALQSLKMFPEWKWTDRWQLVFISRGG